MFHVKHLGFCPCVGTKTSWQSHVLTLIRPDLLRQRCDPQANFVGIPRRRLPDTAS